MGSMRNYLSIWAALAAAWLAGAACTVHDAKAPALAGPSELALALNVTATPDSVPLNGSQSAVTLSARDASGSPKAGVPLRLDIVVGATFQDCGTLSTRDVVTGTDGRAVAVYTAPGLPLPYPQCANFVPGQAVTILATPTGNDAVAANQRVAFITLVPPQGVTILPPAPTPTAAFLFSPSPAQAGAPVQFNASTSCGGPVVQNACTGNAAIATYTWNFGDGTAPVVSNTPVVSHTYLSQQTFPVTLTVTNDRGVAVSITQNIVVQAPLAPTTAAFTLSPTSANINFPVVFDASSTVTGVGVMITDYAWTFGDGTTTVHSTTPVVTHSYATAGTFTISLRVTDNIGSTGATVVTTKTIQIGAGVGGGPVAVFTISQSPGTVGAAITFDGGLSSPSTGSPAIVRWEFDFGDNSGVVGQASSVFTHTYGGPGTYIVTMTVTDTFGARASSTRILVIQ
jgi:PKD repeat protein